MPTAETKDLPRPTFIVAGVLATMFALAYVWQFHAEAPVMQLLGLPDETAFGDRERWRLVLTATVFAALALIVPAIILTRAVRVLRRRLLFQTGIEPDLPPVYAEEARLKQALFNCIKFTPADTSLARKYGGAGLGVPIARQFVEQMGGTFALESAVGEGTRVTIELPLGAGA